MTFALTDPDFAEFETVKFENLLYTPMQEYAKEFAHLNTIYPPKVVEDNLSWVVSNAGLTQYHISETTKYAHVTFFFSGTIEKQYEGETRKLIDTTVEAVQKGIAFADVTAESMNEVMEGARMSTEMMEKMAVELREEAANMMKIDDNVNRVAEIVDNNSATSEETAAVSQEQTAQVATMVQMMEQFTI